MDDIIKLIPVFTIALFFIVALKMQFLARALHTPLSNFLNFSNLLTNTFDFINGSLVFIAFIVIFLIWKNYFIGLIAKWPLWSIAIVIAICVCVVGINFYYNKKMTYRLSIALKFMAEIGLFFVGILFHNYIRAANFDLVKLSLGVLFIFMYLKINLKFELYATVGLRHGAVLTVTFKDDSAERNYFGFMTNTV